ncbi:anaerobic ribonucleoside-triphosphate reductase activating protein [Anaerosolibacter sp.]|uniref:anaerobic ribonucleoside-triphosphate reductase activating protein n=1 Tax=Anaerosolibacter sp. TaxID=1872527 RepID=UPI0026092230|nr:anaerobic ribonucleoside-triphosphate reductase activating protein [Anaerosolibacter sp.]
MYIAGHEKTSFIDYPDKICTMYFVASCNFRCPYCHNGHIVAWDGKNIDEEEVFSFLKKRKPFIDAVCISGGEPTLHKDLHGFIKKIKERGFLVKLDTNGTHPRVLAALLDEKLLDYIAMDIKAPFHKYGLVAGAKVDIEDIKASINIIRHSNIDYEFRTTVCKELHTKEDILEIAAYINPSKRYSIQNFKDGDTVLAGTNQFHPYDPGILEGIGKEIEGYFEKLKIQK